MRRLLSEHTTWAALGKDYPTVKPLGEFLASIDFSKRLPVGLKEDAGK